MTGTLYLFVAQEVARRMVPGRYGRIINIGSVTSVDRLCRPRALPHLLHGEETRVWGDQAYRGQSEVLREHAPHAQDFTHQRYRYKDRIDEVE